MYEQGFGRGKALHTANANRQIEIIKQQDRIIQQNDQVIALLSEVVKILDDRPR
jgi:hypothetical protein